MYTKELSHNINTIIPTNFTIWNRVTAKDEIENLHKLLE